MTEPARGSSEAILDSEKWVFSTKRTLWALCAAVLMSAGEVMEASAESEFVWSHFVPHMRECSANAIKHCSFIQLSVSFSRFCVLLGVQKLGRKNHSCIDFYHVEAFFHTQCGLGTSHACMLTPISVSLPNTTVISGMLRSEQTAGEEERWRKHSAWPHPPAPHRQPSADHSGQFQREFYYQRIVFHTCKLSRVGRSWAKWA